MCYRHNNDLRLDNANFQAQARFSRAQLLGVFSLDGATFADRADLDAIVAFGNVSMNATRFMGPVTLQDCEMLGGLWLDKTVFQSRADFRGVEVHGRTWLTGATLADAAASKSNRGQIRDIVSYGYRWPQDGGPSQQNRADELREGGKK